MKLFISFLITLAIIFPCFGQSTIKMQSENGIYVIPCTVNGLKLKFIFDTGASDVSISLTEVLFMLKNGYIGKDDIVGEDKFIDATGNVSAGETVILKEIKFGIIVLHNVKASVTNTLNAPLLLGQSAIKELGPYKINGNELTIINTPKVNNDSSFISKTPIFTHHSQDFVGVVGSKLLSPDTPPDTIINKVLKAKGGIEKLRAVKDISIEGNGYLDGQNLILNEQYKAPDKYKSEIINPNSGYHTQLSIIINGDDVKMKRLWKRVKLNKKEKNEIRLINIPFIELHYLNAKFNFIVSYEGVESVNNLKAYELKAINSGGVTIMSYYNPINFLCIKKVLVDTQSGNTTSYTYEDYKKINGIMYPFIINVNSSSFSISWHLKYILFNTGLKDEIFK